MEASSSRDHRAGEGWHNHQQSIADAPTVWYPTTVNDTVVKSDWPTHSSANADAWSAPSTAEPIEEPLPTGVAPWTPGGVLALRALAVVCLVAFIAYYALTIFKVLWTGDFRVYVAAVREVMAHPFSPRHETLNLPATLSYAFTPYLYGVAALGTLVGASPYGALQIAACLNLLGVTTGIVALFAQPWWGRGREPTVLAVTFLLVAFVGRDITYFLSSEMSADSWAHVLPYPSAAAWAAFFWTLVALERVLAAGQRWCLTLLAVGVWCTLISHPLTGSWLFGILGVRAVVDGVLAWRARDGARARLAGAAVVFIIAGALATPLWPWVSFLMQGVVTAKEGTALTDAPFSTFATLYLLAGVALVRRALARDWQLLGWLVLGWLASAMVYRLMKSADIDYRARYVFFMGFFVQVLVATQLTIDLLRLMTLTRPLRWRPVLATAVAMMGIAGVAVGLQRCWPTVEARVASPAVWLAKRDAATFYAREFEPLAPYLSEQSVVLYSDPKAAMRLTAATGARSVFVTFIGHLPDTAQRRQDVRRFFDKKASPSTRQQLIARWGATHVLVAPLDRDTVASMTAQFGPPVFHNNALALFATGQQPQPAQAAPARRPRRPKAPSPAQAAAPNPPPAP